MAKTDVLILDSEVASEVNVHLSGGRWEASCPGCGYVMAWAADQETLDGMVSRLAGCPVCTGAAA